MNIRFREKQMNLKLNDPEITLFEAFKEACDYFEIDFNEHRLLVNKETRMNNFFNAAEFINSFEEQLIFSIIPLEDNDEDILGDFAPENSESAIEVKENNFCRLIESLERVEDQLITKCISILTYLVFFLIIFAFLMDKYKFKQVQGAESL